MPASSGNGLAMRVGMFLEALCSFGEVDVVVLAPESKSAASAAYAHRQAHRVIVLDTTGREDTLFRMAATAPNPQQGAASAPDLPEPRAQPILRHQIR